MKKQYKVVNLRLRSDCDNIEADKRWFEEELNKYANEGWVAISINITGTHSGGFVVGAIVVFERDI